jgi:lysophospholipase L1-like esterase
MISNYAVIMVGDSDIDRWPTYLHPSGGSVTYTAASSGATLHDCIALVPEANQKVMSSDVIMIACAGENDISQSIHLDESCNALQQFLSTVFAAEQDRIVHLIFLGPKFEPWLNDDKHSRRDYIRMSQAFGKICTEHALADRIIFVDCLVMFCGDTAICNGALLGGKAKAEKRYFDDDLLHLNAKGYRLWKNLIEGYIASIVRLPSEHDC